MEEDLHTVCTRSPSDLQTCELSCCVARGRGSGGIYNGAEMVMWQPPGQSR